MAEEGIRIPAGSGGLIRYYDEYRSKLQIKPTHVIIAIALVVIFEIALAIIF